MNSFLQKKNPSNLGTLSKIRGEGGSKKSQTFYSKYTLDIPKKKGMGISNI